MQGACVYVSSRNIPTIIMYKELITDPGKVIIVLYRNKYLIYKVISTKLLTNIIPINSIDILTKLPYYNDTDYMINTWCKLVKKRLIELNT